MPNISVEKETYISSIRKIAIGSWKHPKDPTIYSSIEVDISALESYLKQYNTYHGVHVGLHHFTAKVLAICFEKYPFLNRVLIRNKLFLRKDIRIFFTTLLKSKKGPDLSGVSLSNHELSSLKQIESSLTEKVTYLKYKKDQEINRVWALLRFLPSYLAPFFIGFVDFLSYTLNLNPTSFFAPKDRFGSCIISPVGSLGVEHAYIPLYPFSRTPLSIGIGKPQKKPIVKDDVIQIGQVVQFTFSADHRLVDGYELAKGLAYFKKLFNNPFMYTHILGTLDEL